MNKKTTLVKEDINRGRFELIKESPSGHGVYVEKSFNRKEIFKFSDIQVHATTSFVKLVKFAS